MRAALLSLSVLAGTLAACASGPAPGTLSPNGSAPAPIPGYDWILHQDGDDARLSYGVAESDDVRMAFDCRRGARRLDMTALAPAGSEPVILLEAAEEIGRFAAAADEDLIHDGLILSAAAPADVPVLRRFRRVGWLARWQDGVREGYAPHPGSGERIERFFAFCG